MYRVYGNAMLQYSHTNLKKAKQSRPEDSSPNTTGLLDYLAPLMFWRQSNPVNEKALNPDLSAPLTSSPPL